MKRSPENTLMSPDSSPDSSPGSADGVTAYPASDKDRADMLALLRDPNFRMSGGSQFALEIVTALGVRASPALAGLTDYLRRDADAVIANCDRSGVGPRDQQAADRLRGWAAEVERIAGVGEVDQRQGFEVWAGDQGYPLTKLETSDGYLDLRTEGAWEAWQAALASGVEGRTK